MSQPTRTAWRTAERLARDHGEPFLDTDHLLLAVIQRRGSVAARALAVAGLPPKDIRGRLGQPGLMARAPKVRPPTPEVKAVLGLACREAEAMGDEEILPEHILLALCRHTRGCARTILVEQGGLTVERVRRAVLAARA